MLSDDQQTQARVLIAAALIQSKTLQVDPGHPDFVNQNKKPGEVDDLQQLRAAADRILDALS